MTTTVFSYEGLAERLGITLATARRTSNRHRWRKTRDNRGRALIHVPDEYLTRRDAERAASGDFAGDTHKASPGDALRGAIERVPVAVMMARLGELEAEWAARVGRLQAELVEMATRAGASEADAANARAVAEELRQDRDHWRKAAMERRSWWPWRRTA